MKYAQSLNSRRWLPMGPIGWIQAATQFARKVDDGSIAVKVLDAETREVRTFHMACKRNYVCENPRSHKVEKLDKLPNSIPG